jgi:hypothetical protein
VDNRPLLLQIKVFFINLVMLRTFFIRSTLSIIYFIGLGTSSIFSQSCPQLSTYFGKSQIDEFKGICRDKNGNIYAIGNTYNNDLPATPGAFQSTYKANYEAFIVKFDSCGSLIWCTYFGTNGFDSGEKIAYSNDTSIVITGHTDGTDLATTPGCFQSSSAGNNDCFIAKFNLNGQPKWISYFGGTQSDFSYALTIDAKNNIIIGGTSLSPSIHTNSLSFQQTMAGAVDAFMACFNSKGVLKFSSFYGGTNSEDIHDVATDNDGNIIGVGGSFSNNLSTTAGCQQASYNGGMEIYVIKFDSIGNRVFSTYLGGTALDDAYGVATDPQKNIYITGHTSSNDFYHTAVSHQTAIAGSNDSYCLKLTPGGSLVWSTIFGGTFFDNNVHCKIDGNNNIISLINSQSADFPMVGTSNYTVHNGANDIVLAKINSSGQLTWTSYKGGSGDEISGDLVLANNRVFVTGSCSSANFPVVSGNYQLVNNGQEDGFLTTFSLSVLANTSVKVYQNTNECLPRFKKHKASESLLNVSCSDVEKVIVFDILGKEITSYKIENGIVIIKDLAINQIYFVCGYSSDRQLVFTQKVYFSE